MRYAFALAGLAAAAQAGGNTYTLTATEEVTITSCAPTHTNCPYKSASNEWENWSASADPTSTWGSWDPKKTSTSTWGSWDPKASSTSTWGNWDPKASSTSTWGNWDPKASSSSTWGSWDPKASSTSTWGSWDPSKPSATSSSSWGNWDGEGSKTSVKPTSTGNGEWNNWGSATGKPVSASSASCPAYTATAPPAWFSQLPSSVLSSLAAKWTGAPPSDWCYYSYSTASWATSTPVAASSTGTWGTWASASATGASPAAIATYKGDANSKAASIVLGGAAAIAAIVLV